MVTTLASFGHAPTPEPPAVVTEPDPDEAPPAERATVEDAPAERAVAPSPKRKRYPSDAERISPG